MIGRLRGTLLSKQPPWIVLEVGGVGYELEVPMSTMYELPDSGCEAVLLTHYAVKEDRAVLYGFQREAERSLFRSLLKVSGIGARTSLAILSGMSTETFVGVVQAEDIVALSRIPGIGKRTAERIIVELRDRVAAIVSPASGSITGTQLGTQGSLGEAMVALQQLGYKPAEATRLARTAAATGDSAETIIRKALKTALGGKA